MKKPNFFKINSAAIICAISLLSTLSFSDVIEESKTKAIQEATLRSDPFDELAFKMAQKVKESPIKIVLRKMSNSNGLQDPFSIGSWNDFEMALERLPQFKILDRKGQGFDIEAEKLLREQNKIRRKIHETAPIKVEEADAIITGKYSTRGTNLIVNAKLTWLENSSIMEEIVETTTFSILEANSRYGINAFKVENEIGSSNNVQYVNDLLEKVPQNFKLSITIDPVKNAYYEGEFISYRIKTDTDCHIAIFDFAPDNSVRVLFPDEPKISSWIKKGQAVLVPSSQASLQLSDPNVGKGEIGPPFGNDIVVVIACTNLTELYKRVYSLSGKMKEIDENIDKNKQSEEYQKIRGEMRGIVPHKANKPQGTNSEEWAWATTTISTFSSATKSIKK